MPMMPGSRLTGCDHHDPLQEWQYPIPYRPVWRPDPRQSVSIFRKPASAAATVWRRTASRSPANWNHWAWP